MDMILRKKSRAQLDRPASVNVASAPQLRVV
jgi:hypothetical protein